MERNIQHSYQSKYHLNPITCRTLRPYFVFQKTYQNISATLPLVRSQVRPPPSLLAFLFPACDRNRFTPPRLIAR